MTYTREQLVGIALRRLGIPGAGQTASAEDTQAVDEYVGSVMADLSRRNIFQWGDPDQIDDAAAQHLATILADAAAPDFGQPQDDQRRLMAESRLRLLDQAVLSGQPLRVDYF